MPFVRTGSFTNATAGSLARLARLVGASVAVAATVIPVHATAAPGPVPVIESMAVLEATPLEAGERPRDGGSPRPRFRLGGFSDLAIARQGEVQRLWAITDRGPNGTIVDPPVDGQPGKSRRTLPIPEFVPRLLPLEVGPAPTSGLTGAFTSPVPMPLLSSTGKPTSGRPTSVSANAKPIVDPTTREPVPVDPDGFDPEGLACHPDGHFWIAEEYVPSLAEVSAEGRVLRRLVPAGVTLPGATCEIQDSLPAHYTRRRDNRGFESLALSTDGTRLFSMLQSPPEADAAPGEPPIPQLDVPVLELDTRSGLPVAEYTDRLGDPNGEACDWCLAAADGKVSAIAVAGPRTLVILEQSDTDCRLYRIDLPEPPAGATGFPAPPLAKVLIGDLGPLAATFQADIVPGSNEPPKPVSSLKFEGLALLEAGRIALVNDNDFDIDATGSAAADPAGRRTCLWILSLPSSGR